MRRKHASDMDFDAFRRAVKDGDMQRIKDLVAIHPEYLVRANTEGKFPLHWPAEVQSLSSIDCLVDLGADVSQKSRAGHTAEDVAYWNGEFRMGAYTDVCLKIVERLKKGRSSEQVKPHSSE